MKYSIILKYSTTLQCSNTIVFYCLFQVFFFFLAEEEHFINIEYIVSPASISLI